MSRFNDVQENQIQDCRSKGLISTQITAILNVAITLTDDEYESRIQEQYDEDGEQFYVYDENFSSVAEYYKDYSPKDFHEAFGTYARGELIISESGRGLAIQEN